MMQDVATAKSDIAAFATGLSVNSSQKSESNEQFGQLLQDQSAQQSLPQTVKKNTKQDTSANNAPLPDNSKEVASIEKNKTPSIPSTDVKQPVETKDVKNTVRDMSNADASLKQASAETPTRQSTSLGKSHEQVLQVEQELALTTLDNKDLLLPDADLKSQVAELKLELPEKPSSEKVKDAPSEHNVVAEEWLALVESYQKLADIAQATEKLTSQEHTVTLELEKGLPKDIDKSLLKPLAEQQIIYQKDIAAVSPQIEDGEEVAKQQLTANTELLQSLKTDSATPANKVDAKVVLDTAAIEPVALAKNNQLVVENTQPDINTPEIVLATKMADELPVLATKMADELPVLAADDFQLAADLRQITQPLMAPVAVKNNADNAKPASDISLLMALPDKKLIKILEHIAGQVMPSSPTADVMPSEQNISQLAQQLAVAKSPEVAVATDNQAKELISALKSGIEEFKQQLAQGREPGFDLKSLITDAMAKSNDAGISKANVNVQQISQSISQVLDMAQSINRAIEQHQEQTYSAVQRDVAQIQGEQSKSLQFNHIEAKFEKAVNITKPEGHQQLAEKVRWMVNTKNLVADIRLDPAELGSVHVKVAMSGESATVNFVVQSQHARDAMDNATPKLREMLAEKGIELGQSSVEQENKGQSSQGEGQLSQHGSQKQADAELEMTDQVIAQQPIVNGALGGIDYFV